MNAIKEIQEKSFQVLGNEWETPGSIIYSSQNTIKKGDLYLLGYNPGGENGEPFGKSIESLPIKETNDYFDSIWKNRNGCWEKGQAPLQKRVNWLLSQFSEDPKNEFASNLIFFQSRNAEGIDFELANKCWEIHKLILKIVKPKMIIVYGNSQISPFQYIFNKYGGIVDSISSGHGNWKIKSLSCSIEGIDSVVIGFPHLSRYCPIGKDSLIQWIKEKAY